VKQSRRASNHLIKGANQVCPATFIGKKDPNTTKRRSVRVSYVVYGLWLGTLLASGGESSVIRPANCDVDKAAFLFNINLGLCKPFGEIFISNFTRRSPVFAHSAGKSCPADSVVSIPTQSVSNQSTNQNTDEANDCIGHGVRRVLIFTIGLIIGLLFTIGQGKRGGK